jgi:GNAT superfamily N-acetyltransferase
VSSPDRWIALRLADLPRALARTAGPLPPGLCLRTVALPADLPHIAALYNAAFGLDDPEAVTPDQVAPFRRHPGLDPSGAFLALDGDLAVGVGVGSVEVPAAGDATRRGAVELLAVQPAYQRRGIGRALLHAVLGWLAGRGVAVVEAVVQAPTPLAMLERYGFARVAPAAEAE